MANIAHYCLHQLNIKPREFLELDRCEKAFIIASIEMKIESEKKAQKKAKKK